VANGGLEAKLQISLNSDFELSTDFFKRQKVKVHTQIVTQIVR
jgi:hypothetical protein